MEDQLLRANGVGNDRLTNPHALEFRLMYSRAYLQFKPKYFFWILAIIFRKFCISVTAVIFAKSVNFQMAACLLIMFLAFAAHVQARPYMSPSEREDVLKAAAAAATTDVVYARLCEALSKVESRPSKRRPWDYLFFIDVSGHYEDPAMKEAVAELRAFCPLVKWLGSYPSVT